ncbi:MAG TPA: hypothetical protein EYP42_00865 [Aquificales bacterium]|nr:hypothetical protein [Aquificales bacterium]
MINGERALLEEYTKLKNLEKTVELNLAVLADFENLLTENLEELEEYLQMVIEEEKLLLEKLRALLKVLQKNIIFLHSLMENVWEDIELYMLRLALYRELPPVEELKGKIVSGFQQRLDTLRDFLLLQTSLFEEELKKHHLNGKVPLEVYISFLDKMNEFNKQIYGYFKNSKN